MNVLNTSVFQNFLQDDDCNSLGGYKFSLLKYFVRMCDYENETHQVFSITNIKIAYSMTILDMMNPKQYGALFHTLALR